MATIIDTQDEILAKIDALIAATTIPAIFSTQDNDLEYGTLPLVIVDIKTSDPSEDGNLASGDTAVLDNVLELIVVVACATRSVIRTQREYAIDNFMTILNNLQVNTGKIFHEVGIYNEKNCVRVRTLISAFNDN